MFLIAEHRIQDGDHLSQSHGHYALEVYREEWVYNFGSRRFLRIVILEDGVVADVQNGGRGFNPR